MKVQCSHKQMNKICCYFFHLILWIYVVVKWGVESFDSKSKYFMGTRKMECIIMAFRSKHMDPWVYTKLYLWEHKTFSINNGVLQTHDDESISMHEAVVYVFWWQSFSSHMTEFKYVCVLNSYHSSLEVRTNYVC